MEEQVKLLKDPESKEEKAGKGAKTFWAGFVILALFLGGGIYAWQNSVSKVSIGTVATNFDLSEVNLSEILGNTGGSTVSAEEPQKSNSSLLVQTEPATSETEGAETVIDEEGDESIFTIQDSHFLTLLAPNGGETYCLGDQLDIRWEHSGVENIRFYVQQDESAMYDLGVFSAGLDKNRPLTDEVYVQKVEETSLVNPPIGSNYRVIIVDVDDPFVTDTSDDVFAIMICQ